MSNSLKLTTHPLTRKKEMASYVDEYFGKYDNAVIFRDGAVFREGNLAIARKATKVITPEEASKYF